MAMDLAGPGYHINRSNLLVLESKADMQKRGQSGTRPALNRNKRLVRMPPDLFLTDLARKLPTKRVGVRRMRVMASQNESYLIAKIKVYRLEERTSPIDLTASCNAASHRSRARIPKD